MNMTRFGLTTGQLPKVHQYKVAVPALSVLSQPSSDQFLMSPQAMFGMEKKGKGKRRWKKICSEIKKAVNNKKKTSTKTKKG